MKFSSILIFALLSASVLSLILGQWLTALLFFIIAVLLPPESQL